MNAAKRFKVLFLCTGNSVRSIMAEHILKRLGGHGFEAYSAGADPKGVVDPLTLKILHDKFRIDASGARSKSWDEFRNIDFDFVITVCDSARESCPVWPGQPIIAHWGLEDPAAFVGTAKQREQLFLNVATHIYRRIQIFTSLPLAKLDRLRLERLVKRIGTDPEAVASEEEALAKPTG
ncbi:MAG: arsenate reductase ArsC [Myxococcaceae bacterium]